MIIAAMLVATLSANAQEAGQMFIKPMVGGTLAGYRGSDVSDNLKMKLGLVAGAEFGYNMSEQFALTAGLLYTMQGAGNDKNSDYNLKLDYLNIPVLANYYVAPGFAIKAGLQPGFLMSAKMDGHDIKDGYSKFDLSIPLGLSYEFNDFVIDGRYNLGLTKVDKDGEDKVYNSVIMLTVGYKIPF